MAGSEPAQAQRFFMAYLLCQFPWSTDRVGGPRRTAESQAAQGTTRSRTELYDGEERRGDAQRIGRTGCSATRGYPTGTNPFGALAACWRQSADVRAPVAVGLRS